MNYSASIPAFRDLVLFICVVEAEQNITAGIFHIDSHNTIRIWITLDIGYNFISIHSIGSQGSRHIVQPIGTKRGVIQA